MEAGSGKRVYLLKELLDLGFGFCFFFRGLGGQIRGGGEAGVGVEKGVSLFSMSVFRKGGASF